MTFDRRVVRYGSFPWELGSSLAGSAIQGCWFELHRQGGCGAGRLRLGEEFSDRGVIDVGDWVSLEYGEGDRWYLGRVEERVARSPAGVTLELQGLAEELGGVFPGGFGPDDEAPHIYRATDLFSEDPDYSLETVDSVTRAEDVVQLMLAQLVAGGRTHIQVDPERIETSANAADVVSMKFRGEESLRSILKDLALRCGGVAWGVDESGDFFWLNPRTAVLQSFREGDNVLTLDETISRDSAINRVLLTGDYVYEVSDDLQMVSRWRGNYIQPQSIAQYGERRIRIWAPWIRTETDSLALVTEFFRKYARPRPVYRIEVSSQTLPRPWEGCVQLFDRTGVELITANPETVRVEFDHVPKMTMTLGLEDPHELWPEPPHDERWETPRNRRRRDGRVSLTESGTSSDVDASSEVTSSVLTSDDLTSDLVTSSDDQSSLATESSNGDDSSQDLSSEGGTSSSQPESDDGDHSDFPTWWTDWTWDTGWTSEDVTSESVISDE